MELEKFKGQFIPILDWSFFKDEKEAESYRTTYSIDPDCTLFASTILGDIIALRNNRLVEISHDDSRSENDLKLAKNLAKVSILLEETIKIPDYEDCEDIKELKSIRKQIKACRKLAPKNMKDNFELAMEDIDGEIDMLKM